MEYTFSQNDLYKHHSGLDREERVLCLVVGILDVQMLGRLQEFSPCWTLSEDHF